MRRTKIVCTIGPATESVEMLEALVRAGMNVARLNFSHGSLEDHGLRISQLREVERKLDSPIAILLDIQGPKIRLGDLPGERLRVADGDLLYIKPGSGPGSVDASGRVTLTIPYEPLLEQARAGQTIFLDDGLVELKVEENTDTHLVAKVVTGGELRSRNGVILPDVDVQLPAVDENDMAHIRFGVKAGVDFIAASFVRRPEHIDTVREVIESAGGNQQVIAKIENREGVRNIDAIIERADGIMVARGDMGVELPPEEVPIVQKALIEKCNRAGKPVITATQMLDSMARNPRPTRAEVTDVANAIAQGTDAVMLSGETAVGRYPIETVTMMDRIARSAEGALDYESFLERGRRQTGDSVADAIARATCETASDLKLRAIVCSTQSGSTARKVSKYRPWAPILAVTPSEDVVGHLCLVWGVRPIKVSRALQVDAMIDVSVEAAKRSGLVKDGDRVAIAAGVRTGTPGSTNLLQIHVVGENKHRTSESTPEQ